MTGHGVGDLADIIVEEARRRPLGVAVISADRTAYELSENYVAAADNLLLKAVRAHGAGDQVKVERYLDQALRLPRNDMEECRTAAWSAHMLLFCEITDAMEDCDEGDSSWLDAAIRVMAECGPHARQEVEHVLAVADQDWRLSKRESRRIRQVVTRPMTEAADDDTLLSEEIDLRQPLREIVAALYLYQSYLDDQAE